MDGKIVRVITPRNKPDAKKTLVEKVSSEEWEEAIVIGHTKIGDFVVYTNGLMRKDVLWLLKKAEQYVLGD